MATQRFYDGQPGPDIRRELNNFEAILDGTVAAAQDASTAATSASVKAQQWADAAPGVEVETGKYSAKHWADRAQTTVTGGLIYRGSHSAASGAYPATPSLGDYYKISVAGTLGGVAYSVGDSIIYNGTDWDKIGSTDAVTSVAGRVGEVVLTKGDVGLGNVDNTSDASKPISTATQAALDGKEPTIAAGTATQYWRGDKTWRDFFTDVRAATLTGLSTATNAVVAATDTVLAAIGKLQAQVSAKFDKTGGDVNGNINFTGAGRRITGDFSNGTVANRVMFQTSSINGGTGVSAIPNGTGAYSEVILFNASDLSTAYNEAKLLASTTEVSLRSTPRNGAPAIPMTFYVGSVERMRIDTSGNVGIGGTPIFKLDVSGSGTQTIRSRTLDTSGTSIGRVMAEYTGGGGGVASAIDLRAGDGYTFLTSSTNTPVIIGTNGIERMRIDTSGNVLVTNAAGLGYGAGAGGTVVQATSKSTPVTLNKPTGQITMNNAALAAGASVTFQLNNTLINGLDNVIVTPFNNAAYRVDMQTIFNGWCHIRVTNMTGGSLSEAFVINFAIIKGATS